MPTHLSIPHHLNELSIVSTPTGPLSILLLGHGRHSRHSGGPDAGALPAVPCCVEGGHSAGNGNNRVPGRDRHSEGREGEGAEAACQGKCRMDLPNSCG